MEIEAKIELDRNKFDEIHRKIGKPKTNLQKNFVYVFDSGILRIRDENGGAFITIKGKNKESKFSKRTEIECKIPQFFFRAFYGVRKLFGNPFYYEKYRASERYGNCVVSLDRLNGRYFVEIEGREDNINQGIKEFALHGLPIEKRSYVQIIQEQKDGLH